MKLTERHISILVPDDIAENDYVTFLTGPIIKIRTQLGDIVGEEEYKGYNGLPFKIICIQWPYLILEGIVKAVDIFGKPFSKFTRTAFDYRDIKLMKVSKEYFDSFIESKHRQEQPSPENTVIATNY